MQGLRLGTVAHLVALRRTAIGEVSVENAWHLDALVEAVKARRWGHPLDVVEQTSQHEAHSPAAHGALGAAAIAAQASHGDDVPILKQSSVVNNGTQS